MGVDAGGLVVAVISVAVSITFTLWFTRQQTNAALDQARSAEDSARAAARQIELTEQIRKEQTEPYVVVDIRPSDHVSHVFILVIENIGPTVARNVRIQFDPPLQQVGEDDPTRTWKPLRESLLLTNGIPMMPPGRRMEWFFDITSKRFASGLPMQYTATVDADGPAQPVETMTYKIDLSVYGGLRRLGVNGMHDAVKAMEGLAQAANRVATRMPKPARVGLPNLPLPDPPAGAEVSEVEDE